MSKITRANLRGKPLERECYRANTYTQNGVTMCFGLYSEFSDDDISHKCLNCNAYHGNVDDEFVMNRGDKQ